MLKMSGWVLGVDAGGTKIDIALANDGKVVVEEKIATQTERGGADCLARLMSTAQGLISGSNHSIQAIGLASPGIVHPVTKHTYHTWNIPDWDSLDVAGQLERAFHVPVAIENDANMAAIAESAYASHGPSFIFCAVGTGFGAGIILNHQLWVGKSGAAGEIARWAMSEAGLSRHFDYGHLEYLMSGTGFETRYHELTGKHLNGGEIAELAHRGDDIACRIFDDAAMYLGLAAANASTLLDLDAIVLGGGVIFKDPVRWTERVTSIVQKLCLYPPKVRLSALGDKAALMGAIVEGYRMLEGDCNSGSIPR